MFINKRILVYDGFGRYILAQKYAPEHSKVKIDEKFEKFLKEYADLWPPSIKSGGRLIKKTPASLKLKMKAFINRRRDLSFDTIINGTYLYLKDKKRENYAYTISSDYFILKNGASELESWADQYIAGDLKDPEDANFVDSLN